MQVVVIDGQGALQTVLMPGIETVVDLSEDIAVSNVAQVAIPANPLRSGYFIQNLDAVNSMWVNEIADAASAPAAGNTSFKLLPGATWPPVGAPVVAGAISIVGTVDDQFLAREW